MTLEHAIVTRAGPQITGGLAHTLVREEAQKGCTPALAPVPVCIEPPYWDFRRDNDFLIHEQRPWYISAEMPRESELTRYIVWITPELTCDWSRTERFIKELQSCDHPVAFEITGNRSRIEMSFLTHREDATLLDAAFLGVYPMCVLTRTDKPMLLEAAQAQWDNVAFREYFPPPPYSHLFTRPGELKESPLIPLLNILSQLPERCLGIYQVLFISTRPEHDWHAHVRLLLDIEFSQAMYGAMQPYQRYAQQMPSSDLRGMALDADQKSHSDKPFFAAIARVGCLADGNREGAEHLRALAVPMNLFLHGGRPLGHITQDEFQALSHKVLLRDLFIHGASYRPGFLLNSEELSGLVHFPLIPLPQKTVIPMQILDGFFPTPGTLESGTIVGHREHAGQRIPIHIPAHTRRNHGHLLGKPGMGKSWLIEGMCLDDIEKGEGVAVIDPHGDLVQRILGLLPPESLDRVIFFDPGDENWTFLWNMLVLRPGQDPSRVADEFTAAMHNISDGWGDRLANILRQTIAGVLCMHEGTLADVETLLRSTPAQREHLVKQMAVATDNPATKRFWEANLRGYKQLDMQPALNKLGKLMAPRGVGRMLSQPISRIDFRTIMDDGHIFLADLSGIGGDARNMLGTFILSSIYLAALSRSDMPDNLRRQFNIYVDEAHRFIAGSMTDLIAQTRKHRVSICLAHQYLNQFSPEDVDALGTTGFTVILGALHKDVERLLRMHGANFPLKEMLIYEPGDALAHIGAEWVKVRTEKRPETVNPDVRKRAIALSRQKYYSPASETIGAPVLSDDKKRATVPSVCASETEDTYAYEEL